MALRSRDLLGTSLLLRASFPGFLLFLVLGGLATGSWAGGRMATLTYLLALLASVGAGAGLSLSIVWATSATADTLLTTLYGASGQPATPAFSREDALIMQGRYAEAAAALEARRAAEPTLVEAHIRLAELLAGPMSDLPRAAAVFAEARAADAAGRFARHIGHARLAILERLADAEALRAEYLHQARTLGQLPEGEAARRALRRIADARGADPA